jgi:hypothetical protein
MQAGRCRFVAKSSWRWGGVNQPVAEAQWTPGVRMAPSDCHAAKQCGRHDWTQVWIDRTLVVYAGSGQQETVVFVSYLPTASW